MIKLKWINPGEDIASALEVRIAVFVDEQLFVDEMDAIDKIAYHIVAFDDSEVPIGVGRVFEKPEAAAEGPKSCIIGRVAVKKHVRHTGLGSVLMEQLEAKARELGAEQALLSSQLQARPFYEKLGYTAMGSIYMEEHCPHIKMKKMLNS